MNLYKWNSIKYLAVINNNNYTLFEIKNLEIAVIVLYVAINTAPLRQNVNFIFAYIN